MYYILNYMFHLLVFVCDVLYYVGLNIGLLLWKFESISWRDFIVGCILENRLQYEYVKVTQRRVNNKITGVKNEYSGSHNHYMETFKFTFYRLLVCCETY